MKQERRAEQRHEPSSADHGEAVALQEAVDRGQCAVFNLGGFAARLQQRKQRRQEGDAGQERDQHAGACNDPEFRNAAVVRRCERKKAGRDGGRGEGQRGSYLLSGRAQRTTEVVKLVPLGPVADRELNSEINAQSDEQHRECDRD